MKLTCDRTIERMRFLVNLRAYDPVVIGTPPLGIAIDSSDIDIACCADDLIEFKHVVAAQYGNCSNFQMFDTTVQAYETVIVQFRALDWDIELFCQPIPTSRQWGVRHFQIEKRLLALSPGLAQLILALKQAGMKTEPAFAQLLGLSGDPYSALLELEQNSDDELLLLLENGSTMD